MTTFEYPVGVLLFNRPHLVKFVLKSLKRSNLPLNEELLVFHLDGYSGSKFETQLEKNRTDEVEKLVRQFFPKSHIIRQNKNIGIAKSFYVVMEYIFSTFECKFAIFQEEDTFLASHYFQVMSSILNEVESKEWIGALSINNVDHYQSLTNELVVPTFGTREMAFSRQVFLESKEIYGTYLESLGETYRSKNLEDVNRALSKFSIHMRSPMQDVFQHELLRWHKKLHLRINVPGSFQANFSGGESIPGLGILVLLTELFRIFWNSQQIAERGTSQFDFSNLNRNSLEITEKELWNSREKLINELEISPRGKKLILLRNKLGLSRLKFPIETLIILIQLRKNHFSKTEYDFFQRSIRT